jgi:hypothetical protein
MQIINNHQLAHQTIPKAPKTSLQNPVSSPSHSPASTGKHKEKGLSPDPLAVPVAPLLTGFKVKQLPLDFCS